MAEAGTSQAIETNQPSQGHSLPVDHRGWDKSGHRKKPTELGALTSYRPQRVGQVMTGKERARGTHFLETAEGGLSTDSIQKKSNSAMVTDFLDTTEGGSSHDTEKNQLS